MCVLLLRFGVVDCDDEVWGVGFLFIIVLVAAGVDVEVDVEVGIV